MEVLDQNGCIKFAAPIRSGDEDVSSVAGDGPFQYVNKDGSFIVQNCYYNIGGVLHVENDSDVSSLLEGSECFLAFDLRDRKIVAFDTLEDLQTAQREADNYVTALYLIGAEKEILVDLRAAPQIQYFEEGLT